MVVCVSVVEKLKLILPHFGRASAHTLVRPHHSQLTKQVLHDLELRRISNKIEL